MREVNNYNEAYIILLWMKSEFVMTNMKNLANF